MAGIAREEIHAASPPEGSIDMEELVFSLEDILANIAQMSGSVHADEEDNDDEEDDDEEEEYSCGTLADKVLRYQKEFRKYIEIIKHDLEDMGYDFKRLQQDKDARYSHKDGQQKLKDPEAEKSPFERGHKFECGCPGCTAFRESFFADVITDFSIPDSRKMIALDVEVKRYASDHKDNPSDYPCGGKLRGMFKQGSLKYALADIGKDPGMMNHLAV